MPIGAAIGIAGVAGAGASIISGNKSSKAIAKGADTAAASADKADVTNRYIFDTTRADYAPAREVGQGALYKLADMYGVPHSTSAPATSVPSVQIMYGGNGYGVDGDFLGYNPTSGAPSGAMTPGFDGFQASPGYQFRVGEATKAIERSAAARGNLRSGATMDALQRRVQGEASSEYENFANRLAALAGVGQSANAGSASAGSDYAAGSRATAAMTGNAAIAAGNARASAYQNTGNAINNGIQNVAGAYLYSKGFGGGGGSMPTSGWGTPGLY